MSNNELKDRVYAVTIGFSGQENKTFEGFKFDFNIEKFADSTPNKADVTITNLSKSSQDFIKKGMNITVTAGYKADNGVIFSGKIDKVYPSRNGTDDNFKIESKDGAKEFRNIMLNKSFSPNTNISTIINYVVGEFGFSKGKIKGIKGKFSNGVSINQSAKSYLDKLSKSYNFTYTVNDGVIHILGNNESINTTAILLDSSSGLIGSPEKTDKGYKLKSLLRWNLYPLALLRVESEKITGNFRINNINHNGGTHQIPYYTEIEVLPI